MAGYGSYLPEYQERAINLATLLYLLTDEKGHLDLDKPVFDKSLIEHYIYQPKNWD